MLLSEKEQQQVDKILESKIAKWAYYFSRIPFLGLILYFILAPIALYRISRIGQIGFYFLEKALILCVLYSVLFYAFLFTTAYGPTWMFPFGFKHGHEFEYSDSILMQYTEYKYGKEHGISLYYHGNGTVGLMICSKNGIPITSTYWYANGQKKEENKPVDGKNFEKCVKWHKNGNKWMEGEYYSLHNKRGKWVYWDEQGIKTFEENFDENGVLVEGKVYQYVDTNYCSSGTFKYYNNEGYLIREETYNKDGCQTSVKEFTP